MENLELKYINIEEFEKDLYSYYLNIFPTDERKTLESISLSYKKNYTKIIEILYKEEIIGFMILNKIKDNGYIILDYFAILPEYRNKKFGTKALKILLSKEKENKGIFIEIEKVGLGKNEEENLLRIKRQEFYKKIGFKKLKFDLFLFGVVYTPYLYSNVEDDENVVINEILSIYEVISGKDKIKQNCKIIRNSIM